MIIYISGKPAVLKKDASFDYVSENRLFMGRDAYTFNLSFPMKDCPQNIDIFGHLDRMDVRKSDLQFECEIRSQGFYAYGTLSVTGISESEVEGQFVEGRCEQTATDPFEETYINDLDLGLPPTIYPSEMTPRQAWAGMDGGREEVALPWINDSYPDAPNNWVKYVDGDYVWDDDVISPLSWQPYLIIIAKRICNAIDYDYDFTEWENSGFRYLIICNTLPSSWEAGYKDILPRWSVLEFFERLELLLCCEFDFDHRARTVRFSFSKTVINNIPPVKLVDVIDEYSGEITMEDDSSGCDYIAAKRLVYKDTGHAMQPYYSCDWFVDGRDFIEFGSVAEMLHNFEPAEVVVPGEIPYIRYGQFISGGGYRGQSDTGVGSLLYCRAENTFFVFRLIGTKNMGEREGDPSDRNYWSPIYVLQPVNQFGNGKKAKDDDDEVEIEFVPVCLVDTYISDDENMGYVMSLDFSDDNDISNSQGGQRPAKSEMDDFSKNPGKYLGQMGAASLIEEGEKRKNGYFYDTVYIGFWTGTVPSEGLSPYPVLDRICIPQQWRSVYISVPSLRISDRNADMLIRIPQVNPHQKFKFSWIAYDIPNPRALFNIRGQLYVCEKITATFTEDGMSQLLKGEFYPVVD